MFPTQQVGSTSQWARSPSPRSDHLKKNRLVYIEGRLNGLAAQARVATQGRLICCTLIGKWSQWARSPSPRSDKASSWRKVAGNCCLNGLAAQARVATQSISDQGKAIG